MNRIVFLLAVFCMVVMCNAQMLPDSKPLPTFMADSSGKPLAMDFSIELTDINGSGMPFSVLSQRPLLIYYFGPHCPYCQKNFGGVQQVAKEYEQRGLTSIAVSTGNVSRRDILQFISDRNGTIPFFQDSEQGIGKNYGDGYVPRVYLVYPDGKIIRYSSTDANGLKDIKAGIEKMLGITK